MGPVSKIIQHGLLACSMALGGLLMATGAQAAAPAAGTIITNQASATYNDSLGVSRTVTSNTVETLIAAKFGLTLTADNNKDVAPNTTSYFPHTLTNTGNTSDSFKIKISALSDTTKGSTCAIFADNNGDGQPDSTTAIVTGNCASVIEAANLGPIGAGQTYKFVVGVTVPAGATAGSANLKVDAQSVGDTTVGTTGYGGTATTQNTDTLNVVTNGAVFEMLKTADKSSVQVGDTVTYTIKVKNTGTAAGGTTVTDVLGSGSTSSLLYVGSSGKLDTTSLTDATGGIDATDANGATVDYSVSGTVGTAPNTISAVFANIGVGKTATLTFQAKVTSGAAAGTSGTTNVASYTCSNPAGCTTNPGPSTVTTSYGVTANTSASSAGAGVDATAGTPGTDSNDVNKVTSATAGSTISFSNYIWNKGNIADSYNITLTNNTYPAGTTLTLYQADGVTPLASGKTPEIPAYVTGSTCPAPFITDASAKSCGFKVVLKVTLPANAPASSAPVGVNKVATSVGDPTKKDAVTDQIDSVTAASLILSNDAAGTLTGTDAAKSTCTLTGSTGTCTPTGAVVSGKSRFPLFMKSNLAGYYDLAASTSNFSAGSTPGWSVVFYASTDPTCASIGSALTSVPLTQANVNSNAPVQVACAEVSGGSTPGTTDFYFRSTSQSVSTLTSTKRDAVSIATQPGITLTPNNSSQVTPGGTTVYSHILTNTGSSNLTCGMPVSGATSASGWTSVVYIDANNNGILDPAEEASPVTDATNFPAGALYTDGSATATGTLAQGKAVRYFVKVTAPASAVYGSSDVRTMVVTPSCSNVSPQTVTDTTTVVSGGLTLEKKQALSSACTTMPSAFGIAQISAKPAECVCYQVVAKNSGSTALTNVKIADTTPTYTKLSVPVTPSCTNGTVGGVATDNTIGEVTCSAASLAAGATVTMQFCVRVDQ